MKNMIKTKINKSRVFKAAWQILRANSEITFSDALKAAWSKEKSGLLELNFDVIYNKYHSEVFGYIMSKVHYNSVLAEEITNDVFLRVDKHLSSYNASVSKIFTWICFIANNIIIDHLRKRKLDVVHISNFVDENGNEYLPLLSTSYNADDINNKEKNEKINSSFNKLKGNTKLVAIHYFIDELQYTEIAELLDVPLGTVKALINRARKVLTTELNGEFSSCKRSNNDKVEYCSNDDCDNMFY